MKAESHIWLLAGVLFAIALSVELLVNQDYSEFNMLDGLLYPLQFIVTIGCFYYYFKKRKEEQQWIRKK